MADEKDEKKVTHMWRALSSMLLTRADLVAKLGKQFSGARDLYEVFGYRKQLTFADFLAAYHRDGLAARIIDAPAEATWQGGIKIEDEFGSVKDSAFEEAFTELADRIKLFHFLERTDKLAGLGQYAVLFIGVAGPQENLALPLRRSSLNRVIYVAPFSQEKATIEKWVTDSGDEDYAKPLLYRLQIGTVGQMSSVQRASRSLLVHKSRIIHVADGLLENEILGRPRLEKVFNRLDDLAKVVGGSAETFWLTANRGMHLNVEGDAELDPADAAAMAEQVEDYQHQLRRFLQTRGVKINPLGSDVANPEAVFKTLIATISGATGIPQRILLGSEMGQLASSQDRANWAARIASRQKSFAEACMLRPFVDRLIDFGALPDPKNNSYQVTWPDALVLSEVEKAQRANQIASASNNLNSAIVAVGEYREKFLGLPHDLPK